MTFTTLISTNDLSTELASVDWRIIDCRFNLMNAEKGLLAFKESHLPLATYAHLEEDLSGQVIDGETGRHPLPQIDTFTQLLSTWGIDDSIQVILYDDLGGMIAARLWWLLRWLGHEKVAVLDGGWQKWIKENRPVNQDIYLPESKDFVPREQTHLVSDVSAIEFASNNNSKRLLDARSNDRYQGKNEVFDPVAGHIPGAISAPCTKNLASDGCFLGQESLRKKYTQLLDGFETRDTILYCGSGITAAHNILALLHAGLGDCQLYPGSWSEWITNTHRPITLGESP